MEDKYYVYKHIKKSDGTIFYIGKGCANRAYSDGGRNYLWREIVENEGYEVEIIETELPEEEAYEAEAFYVNLYKGMGLCEANITDGGDGWSKKDRENIWSHWPEEEQKKRNKKVSEALTGRDHTWGDKISESLKKNRRGAFKTKAWVTPKGSFRSCRMAGEHNDINYQSVRHRCDSTAKKWKGWYRTELLNCDYEELAIINKTLFWKTPKGEFRSIKEAGIAHGRSGTWVHKRCSDETQWPEFNKIIKGDNK